MKKIEIGKKMVVIGTREEMKQYESHITAQSSTEAQPYASVNFLDGKPVGGTTINESYYKMIIEKSEKAGAKITEI